VKKKNNGVFYTDTDSVSFKQPMNESLVSPNELGLCKGTFDLGIFISKKPYDMNYGNWITMRKA